MKSKYALISLALGLGLVLGLFWALGHRAPAHAAPTADREVCPSGCAYSSIQAAVDAANPGDVVKVAQGTYTGVQNVASLNTGTFTATQIVVITKSITLRGGYNDDFTAWDPDTYHTILDAQGLGRAIAITGTVTPTLEGLYITGGDADELGGIWSGAFWTGHTGGGVYVYQATAIISGNHIFSNVAPIGGGMTLFYSDATLVRNEVYDNIANDGGGGGMYLWNSPATLNDNIIHGNTTIAGWGGGIDLNTSNATLNRNIIFNNMGDYVGGGISIDSSQATLTSNRIYSNTSDYGGGAHIYHCSSVLLNGNIITGNAAWYGGGVYVDSESPTLVNTVIADNHATEYGAGIYIRHAAPRLLHTTIARNHGAGDGDGSAIYVTDNLADFSTVAMTNTIIADHTIGITMTAGNTVTLDATLWHANTTPWSGNVFHTHDYNGDPAFALDGYHILTGSMALDRGVAAGVTNDVDGQTRPQGAGYDLGADEFPSAPPGVTWEKQVSVNGAAFQDWEVEPFAVAPGDAVVVVDRVWVTGTGSVSFALTDTWTSSLVWGGHTASSGSVTQGGSGAIWTADTVPANTWHTLTQTFTAEAAPTYVDTLTETLIVQGLTLQLPERIIEFEQPRAQPLWDKTVRVNAGPPQPWNARQFTVQDGDTLTIVDRVWVTHTDSVTFTLAQAWGAGLVLQGQAYDTGTVVTSTGALTWHGSGEQANQWHTLTTTLRVNGAAWLYESITETLTVADAATQLPQRHVNLLNLSGVVGCYARVNDGSTDYRTVQSAIDAAQPSDAVKVAGRCTAVNDHGGLAQIAYITQSITLRGGYTTTNWTTPDPIAHPTTLDAQGRGRVVYVSGSIAPTIQGLRITGGDPTDLGGAPWGDVGGGIYVEDATALISGNLIYSNTAASGSGVFLDQSATTMNNNTIVNNVGTDGTAGVYLHHSPATLTNNTVSHNQSAYAWGGGINVSSSDATLTGNTIAHNHAGQSGGGVSISDCDAILTGNRIYSNTANSGGGVQVYFGNPTLSSNVITGNVATWRGGGLDLEGGAPTLVNNAVVNNQAVMYGAGIYAVRTAAQLLHTTLAHNTGGDGSGLYVTNATWEYSTLALTNTIIADHTVGVTVTAGNAAALNATLWHANSVTNTSGAGTINHTNDRSGDPVFAPDGYHLGSTSAAIDQGVNAGVTTDLDGQSRPQYGGYDLGADEFICATPTGVTVAGPTKGFVSTTYTFVATVLPADASVPVTYTWSPPPLPTHVLLSRQSAITSAWGTPGDYTITVTVANCGDSRTDAHTITISTARYIYMPLVLRNF
jgi:hypothetical protein